MTHSTLFDNSHHCSRDGHNPPACSNLIVWSCTTINVHLCARHLDQVGLPCCACPHADVCQRINPRAQAKKDSNTIG